MDRLKPSGRACANPGGQDDRSPVTRDCHAGICGSRRVKVPPATQQADLENSYRFTDNAVLTRPAPHGRTRALPAASSGA
jgi:hypothetical protein